MAKKKEKNPEIVDEDLEHVRCGKCKDTGSCVNEETGQEVICECRLRRIWKSKLGELVKCGPIPENIKDVVKELIDTHPKEKPKHYYIRQPEKGRNPEEWYRKFLTYYLVTSMEFMDFKMLRWSTLVEVFYEKGHGVGVFSEDLDNQFYRFPQRTLIIICDQAPNSGRDRNILDMFLDTYKDRNVFVYINKEADDVTQEFLVKDGSGEKRPRKTVKFKGVYNFFDENKVKYGSYQDLVKKFSLA